MHPKRRINGINKAMKIMREWDAGCCASDDEYSMRREWREENKHRRLINTRKVCSSPHCCGNPRKMSGKTVQERKQDQRFKQMMNEIRSLSAQEDTK